MKSFSVFPNSEFLPTNGVLASLVMQFCAPFSSFWRPLKIFTGGLGPQAPMPARHCLQSALNVIVDEQLVWKNNLDSVASEVSKGIGMRRLMKKFVPQQMLISVYNAIMISHFDYCSLVWENC